jgi:hypothetical protein
VDGFGGLAEIDPDWDAVAEEVVDGLVVAVEIAGVVVGFFLEYVDGAGDLDGGVAVFEVVGEEVYFDVGVVGVVAPVAQVFVAEFVGEEVDDALLGGAFGFADVAHGGVMFPKAGRE